jgi:6-phosphogluconolactonase
MATAPDIRVARDVHAWAHEAAGLILAASEDAIRSHGRFLLALSGGSTPRTLYATLATPPWKERFDWARIFFLFGDERCVPPEHPDSNFGMADAALFRPLGISPDRIFRIKGEAQDPRAAARDYEETLRRLTNCPVPGIPRIDLILLGLGDDGHTASLFPGTAALHEPAHLVTLGEAPTGIRSRLTMTLGVLNRATVVLFLVAGAGKAPIVRAVLEPRCSADRELPAAMVAPDTGRLTWMLDRSAATQLSVRHEELRGHGQT